MGGGLLCLAALSAGTLAIAVQPAAPEPPIVSAPPALTSAEPVVETWPDPEAVVKAVVQRSLFDHTQVGQSAEADDDDLETDLPYLLLATLVAEPARYSSALIVRDEGGARAMGYGLGDALEPGAIIVDIQANQVTLRRADGTLEYLTPPDPGELAERRRERSAGGKKVIRRTGRGKYEVSDAAMAALYEDPDKTLKSVRLRTYRSMGVRLSRVSSKSPLRRMGIRSGDVISSVNGKRIREPQDFIDAWRTIEGSSTFEVELQRRRRRRWKDETLSYRLL